MNLPKFDLKHRDTEGIHLWAYVYRLRGRHKEETILSVDGLPEIINRLKKRYGDSLILESVRVKNEP